MLEKLSKENFNQILARFSVTELENLTEKFPYFHQAHLLLAKKYQQENNLKFDEQLQLAALYTQDKELFFSLFNEKPATAKEAFASVEKEVEQQAELVSSENIVEEGLGTETTLEIPVEEKLADEIIDEIITEEKITLAKETVVEEPVEEIKRGFKTDEPHSFDEWLSAFTQTEVPKTEPREAELLSETQQIETQNDELEKLIISNLPIQELMEEETHYAKGLDSFIEGQKQKHKPAERKIATKENELPPELITETMAKLYVAQKKYSSAIRAYEILSLKYPEKSDLFAARISELKNF